MRKLISWSMNLFFAQRRRTAHDLLQRTETKSKKKFATEGITRLSMIFFLLLLFSVTLGAASEISAGTYDIALERFTIESWKTGIGWREPWYHEGRSKIVAEGNPHSGTYHMRLRGREAWTDRPIDLSGYDNARLGIYVKVKSFEKNDYADLMIKSGNKNWKRLRRFTKSDSTNRYHYYEFDLKPHGLNRNFWIGFEAEMDGTRDYLYIDDIRFFTQETVSLRPMEEPLFGVTIDDISNARAIKQSLEGLARRPYARIVFDEYMQPSYYKKTVADLHTVAGIMGSILDSYYVKEYGQKRYEQRTRNYINAMADDVDIWEVGNEINGEWLGKAAMDKAAAAYDIVKAAGKPTALTLYYNGTYDNGQPTANNCWERPEHQMQVWAEQNVPERMKKGLDWVFVSYYEEDCENISPNWHRVFDDLHQIFPNAKLGFGEIGSANPSQKEKIIRRYYSMHRIRPEFHGGFFWWYFNQDMVPKGSKMWKLLNSYARSWDKQYH